MKLRFPFSPPRPEDGTLLPAGLLALLVSAAVLQLTLTGSDRLPEEGVGRFVPVTADAHAVGRASPAPVVLARPIFSPTRTAAAVPIAAAGQVLSGPLGGAFPVGMIARGRVARLFLKLPDGSVRTMPIGSIHQGWRLVGLADEGARFVRGNERVTLPYGSSAPVSPPSDDGEEEEEE